MGEDDLYPEVIIGIDWVSVRWGDCDPYHVVDRQGAVTERLTLPALDGPAALPFAPVGGAT